MTSCGNASRHAQRADLSSIRSSSADCRLWPSVQSHSPRNRVEPKIVSRTRANGIARRQLKYIAWIAIRARRLLVALRDGLACGAAQKTKFRNGDSPRITVSITAGVSINKSSTGRHLKRREFGGSCAVRHLSGPGVADHCSLTACIVTRYHVPSCAIAG